MSDSFLDNKSLESLSYKVRTKPDNKLHKNIDFYVDDLAIDILNKLAFSLYKYKTYGNYMYVGLLIKMVKIYL